MPRTFSEDEWELKDLPRQLAYEQSRFENPHLGRNARLKHARLLARQEELTRRIRRCAVLDRWYLRRYRPRKIVAVPQPVEPLTPMRMDEIIVAGKIVDQGW
jgi:hypothetical protein